MAAAWRGEKALSSVALLALAHSSYPK